MAGVFDLELPDAPDNCDDQSDDDCIEVEDNVEVSELSHSREISGFVIGWSRNAVLEMIKPHMATC